MGDAVTPPPSADGKPIIDGGKPTGARPKIVFFGSGPVAASSLELLLQHATIECVVTKPQPPHHHGSFPVIELCQRQNLKMYTPANKVELTTLVASQHLSSVLGVVIDYGIIIEQTVIDYFAHGIVNSHFSLLPALRGADPISFAVLSGQPQTGVSLMVITAGLDEGPILTHGTYDMPPSITTPSLTGQLILLSDQLLCDTLANYHAGSITALSQTEYAAAHGLSPQPSYSRKLTKADGHLDFNKPASVLEREIRAYLDWPRSRTTLAGKDVIITAATVLPPGPHPPSTVYVEDSNLIIATAQGDLQIDSLQPAGKKQMTAQDFLAGHRHLL